MKYITITIDPEGQSIIEAHGYKGPACLEATREIEEALGAPLVRKNKPDLFRREKNRRRQALGHNPAQ